MKKFLNKINKIHVLAFIVLILICVIASVVFNANKPKYNVFVRTPNLNIARVRHTATLLNDGRVLIVGGDPEIDKNALRTAEVYDPVQNKFILLTNRTNIDHSGSRAFLLKNGQVVILDYNGIELFDPKTNTFKLVSRMLIPRHDFGAVLLKDDRMLIYRGWIRNYAKNRSQDSQDVYESEIYNPINNNTYYVNKSYCIEPRDKNLIEITINVLFECPVLLQDGKINFLGHYTNVIYDPANNNFSRQYIPAINKNYIGSAIMLNNQKILIIGKDLGNGLIFDPQSQNVFSVPNEKKITKYIDKYNLSDLCYKTILLKNGNVLITNNYLISGFMRFYTPVVKAELYNPKLNRILPSADMNEKRYQYTATLLKNGNVLFMGGYTHTAYLLWGYKDKKAAKTAELFIP